MPLTYRLARWARGAPSHGTTGTMVNPAPAGDVRGVYVKGMTKTSRPGKAGSWENKYVNIAVCYL